MLNGEPLHPGALLESGYLDPLGVTPSQLADAIGVARRRIVALIRGKARLTPDLAARLGAWLQVPAVWFLDAQTRWDAHLAEAALPAGAVSPFQGLADVIVTPRGIVRVTRSARKPLAPMMVSASSAGGSPVEEVGTRVVRHADGTLELQHR